MTTLTASVEDATRSAWEQLARNQNREYFVLVDLGVVDVGPNEDIVHVCGDEVARNWRRKESVVRASSGGVRATQGRVDGSPHRSDQSPCIRDSGSGLAGGQSRSGRSSTYLIDICAPCDASPVVSSLSG